MLTNYQKVLEFNNAFGVKTNKTPQYNIYDMDPKLVQYRLDLINEEVDELKESIVNKDFKESIDALCDIMYVTLGAFTAFGVDADKAFDLVQNSNMSKLCVSEDEAKLTVESYKQDTRYDSPDYRLSDDGKHYVVFNRSTSKILKSINYSEVNFDTLFKVKND